MKEYFFIVGITSTGIFLQGFFFPGNQSAGYFFSEITHTTPPPPPSRAPAIPAQKSNSRPLSVIRTLTAI